MASRSVLPLLYGPEDHATSVTTCRILYQRHPRLTQVVLEKKLLKLSWKGDTLSTFKRHLKFHLFQSAFTVQSSCASDSDSFSRFWRYINLSVCMYMYDVRIPRPRRTCPRASRTPCCLLLRRRMPESPVHAAPAD